jgi:hypothetical protein
MVPQDYSATDLTEAAAKTALWAFAAALQVFARVVPVTFELPPPTTCNGAACSATRWKVCPDNHLIEDVYVITQHSTVCDEG